MLVLDFFAASVRQRGLHVQRQPAPGVGRPTRTTREPPARVPGAFAFPRAGRGLLVESAHRASRPDRRSPPLATLVLRGDPSARARADHPQPHGEPPTAVGGWTISRRSGRRVLGVLLVLGLVSAYLRFAPSFYGSDKTRRGRARAGCRPEPAPPPPWRMTSPQAAGRFRPGAARPGPSGRRPAGAAAAAQAAATAAPEPGAQARARRKAETAPAPQPEPAARDPRRRRRPSRRPPEGEQTPAEARTGEAEAGPKEPPSLAGEPREAEAEPRVSRRA